jgi:hypothetical protein
MENDPFCGGRGTGQDHDRNMADRNMGAIRESTRYSNLSAPERDQCLVVSRGSVPAELS